MASSVVLNLNEPVSVRDLRQFLSLVPDGVDSSDDIRMRYANESSTGYLEISIPPIKENAR
jgi:hypothetical protein